MNEEKIRLNLKDAPWMECSEKNKVFGSQVLFKRISPLLSPSGKEEFVPIEVIVCEKCKKVPRFFYERAPDIPEDLKSDCTF